MSKLTGELEKEHEAITETLNRVKHLGITSAEGRKTLLAARKAFLAHLEKEDRQLYPVLEEASKTDSGLKSTLAVFAKDMDEISTVVPEFFEKYSEGGSGIEFTTDFGSLHAILSQRIGKEERIIHTRFDQTKG